MDPIQPLPWYIAGPLIGLVVPALLLFGGKVFGISANLRHACAALPVPESKKPGFLRYDWRHAGLWNFVFILGIAAGGFVSIRLLGDPSAALALAPDTIASLRDLGLSDLSGFVPADLFSWSALTSAPGLIALVGGGFLLGFGARWAGGCTSGHAISGLADLQVPSLVAVLGFFIGGLLAVHVLLPALL